MTALALPPGADAAQAPASTTAAGEATRRISESRLRSASSKNGAGTGVLGKVGSNTAAHRHATKGAGAATGVPGAGGAQAPSTAPSAGRTTAPGGGATAPTSTAKPSAGSITPPAASASTPTTLSRQPALTNAPLGGIARPATRARAGKDHISALAIAIAALGALLALACAAWALARRRAFEPHWWLSMRHAMAEAGYRAAGTWAEFSDWARLGR
jgi:hypothetical protein